MSNYPLLNLFLTMLYFFLWVLWIFLLIRIVSDVFRSSDLSGWGKAGWTLLLIVLPFIGALAYLVARGSQMHLRENRRLAADDDALRQYFGAQSAAAGPGAAAPAGTSVADELTKLAGLRDQGVLTDEEFTAEKGHLLSQPH